MEKEKFISKLNIKDYNNQLEKILTKKTFSEDTKNLLLSMLYKIENAYDDYSLVNGSEKTKRETLEEILEIIEKDCEKINVIKTKESKAIPEEKTIITYLNARKMLYEIYQIKQKKFIISNNYEIIKSALEETLNQGYSIASNEVIRDFDGWSWNIVVEEIENKIANFIYQTIKLLTGNEFLEDWQNNENEDYIIKLVDILEKKYKTELADKILKLISQISILNIVEENEEEQQRLILTQEKLEEEFAKIDNKKEYLEELGKQKKEIVDKIKKIDNTIINDRKLKEEFITRNELLDMNHRIFSLSDLVEVMEKERDKLMQELNMYNKKMEPLNFIKDKMKLESKLQILKELDLKKTDKKIYNTKIKELIKTTIEAMKIQINNIEEKENLIKVIYRIRHYILIYVEKDKQIKDMVDTNGMQKMILTKACKERVLTIFSPNIKENYEIIKNILQPDIIELEKIYFKFIKSTDKILLEIYDEENIYKTVELIDIKELNVKFNKKIKVFI